MIFRLSQKLATKIKAGKLAEKPADSNPYADWSAHVFTADRAQYILLTNTPSLYSVVMFGRGITDENAFLNQALGAIRQFMEADGQEFVFRRFIVPASGEVTFAKSANRSVISSMNDLIYHAKALLIEDGLSPQEVGFKLNEIPFSQLSAGDVKKYARPKEVFKTLGTK